MVGFGFLVGLGRGVLVMVGVWLGSGVGVGDSEGVFVTGWKGVRVAFGVGELVEVDETFMEIRRG